MNHNLSVHYLRVLHTPMYESTREHEWNAHDYRYCYLIGPYQIVVMSQMQLYGCPQTFPFYVRRSGWRD